jgi:hypothetical protein
MSSPDRNFIINELTQKANQDFENNNDKSFAIKLMQLDGLYLKDLHDDLKKDPETVLTAVKSNGAALKHAGGNLQNNPQIVLEAVKNTRHASQYANSNLQNDPNITDAKNQHTPLSTDTSTFEVCCKLFKYNIVDQLKNHKYILLYLTINYFLLPQKTIANIITTFVPATFPTTYEYFSENYSKKNWNRHVKLNKRFASYESEIKRIINDLSANNTYAHTREISKFINTVKNMELPDAYQRWTKQLQTLSHDLATNKYDSYTKKLLARLVGIFKYIIDPERYNLLPYSKTTGRTKKVVKASGKTLTYTSIGLTVAEFCKMATSFSWRKAIMYLPNAIYGFFFAAPPVGKLEITLSNK